MAKTMHPAMTARAAATKAVYAEKRTDKTFMAQSPKARIGIVSREVSQRLKGK